MIVKNRTWAEKKTAAIREQIAHLSGIRARLPYQWGKPDPYRAWVIRQLSRKNKRLQHYEAQL